MHEQLSAHLTCPPPLMQWDSLGLFPINPHAGKGNDLGSKAIQGRLGGDMAHFLRTCPQQCLKAGWVGGRFHGSQP